MAIFYTDRGRSNPLIPIKYMNIEYAFLEIYIKFILIYNRLGFNIEVGYVTITTVNRLTQFNHRPI